MTKWVRQGKTWVPADATLSLTAALPNTDGDNIELREKVALCGVQAYLKMLMMDNFIHADLHPGNVTFSGLDPGAPGGSPLRLLTAAAPAVCCFCCCCCCHKPLP